VSCTLCPLSTGALPLNSGAVDSGALFLMSGLASLVTVRGLVCLMTGLCALGLMDFAGVCTTFIDPSVGAVWIDVN